MKNRVVKERLIFSNYGDMYTDDDIKEIIKERRSEEDDEETEITDEDIWKERSFQEEMDWEDVKYELEKFFEDKHLLLFGAIGRWNGVVTGWQVYNDFMRMFYDATEDCDYIKFYDENGHLFLHCSHHDGSCTYEIKELSDEGREYLDRWEYSWNDRRKPGVVGKQLVKRYSKVPHYLHKQFGCKIREYEPQSKERFVSMLNNQARSFYS